MTRDEILKAIRSATDDLGRVPGERAFYSRTGITRDDLYKAGFSRYGDAVQSAGFEPNQMQAAHGESEMLAALALLTRRIGRFPATGDLKAARTSDPSLPSYEAYRRLGGGSYPRVRDMLLKFCRKSEEFTDVVSVALEPAREVRTPARPAGDASEESQGLRLPRASRSTATTSRSMPVNEGNSGRRVPATRRDPALARTIQGPLRAWRVVSAFSRRRCRVQAKAIPIGAGGPTGRCSGQSSGRPLIGAPLDSQNAAT
jgi:hypothetical protein